MGNLKNNKSSDLFSFLWNKHYQKIIFYIWFLGSAAIIISDHYLLFLGINNITPAEKISLFVYFSTLAAIVWYTKETFDLKEISSKALTKGEIMRKEQIKTDLRIIGKPLYNNQPDNSIVGRIIIKNKSIFKAEYVEADAEGLAINQKKRKNFLPCPLNWTHSQLFSVDGRYQPARNIHPSQSVYLDIYKYYKESNNLKLATIAGQDIKDFSSLEPGENNVTIRLYQDSGQTLKIELTITWGGKPTPTIKIDHFFRLLN